MKILHYVTGPIQVNTYVVYDEESRKAFIVDPGGYDKRISDKIKELGLDLQYIILTHGHGDHIGGVEGMRRDFPGIQVVANVNEDMLLDAAKNDSMSQRQALRRESAEGQPTSQARARQQHRRPFSRP